MCTAVKNSEVEINGKDFQEEQQVRRSFGLRICHCVRLETT